MGNKPTQAKRNTYVYTGACCPAWRLVCILSLFLDHLLQIFSVLNFLNKTLYPSQDKSIFTTFPKASSLLKRPDPPARQTDIASYRRATRDENTDYYKRDSSEPSASFFP
jgi:hypothetical protein